MPSSAVPEDDFAIVMETERRFIVASGTYTEMVERATRLNQAYQSTAYKAERWIEGRIW